MTKLIREESKVDEPLETKMLLQFMELSEAALETSIFFPCVEPRSMGSEALSSLA